MMTIGSILKSLDEGGYDKTFSWLYCRPIEKVTAIRTRYARALEGYKSVFGKDDDAAAAIFSAPGRTELGGNHTDHQRGKVLTGSVDMDAVACASPNGSSVVRMYSDGYGMVTVDCSELAPQESEKETTAALIRGVAAGVASCGYEVKGFDAYVTSDVPGGSGLSSSACIEVLLGAILNGLFCDGAIAEDAIAKIGQRAENEFFGKPSGLLDQMGCAMGGVVAIDFEDEKDVKYKRISPDFSGYALCIVNTGADHADLTADYAAVPTEMKAVAAEFGKNVLREVSEDDFYANIPSLRKKLGDRAVLRAVHFYDDCRRVDEQTVALEKGDISRFLELVKESGRSSWMYLQNIATYRDAKEQPVAVALAVAEHLLKDCGAWRVHGGGFAGTIQAFVPQDKVEAFSSGMDAVLGEGACRVTNIRPVGCHSLTE